MESSPKKRRRWLHGSSTGAPLTFETASSSPTICDEISEPFRIRPTSPFRSIDVEKSPGTQPQPFNRNTEQENILIQPEADFSQGLSFPDKSKGTLASTRHCNDLEGTTSPNERELLLNIGDEKVLDIMDDSYLDKHLREQSFTPLSQILDTSGDDGGVQNSSLSPAVSVIFEEQSWASLERGTSPPEVVSGDVFECPYPDDVQSQKPLETPHLPCLTERDPSPLRSNFTTKKGGLQILSSRTKGNGDTFDVGTVEQTANTLRVEPVQCQVSTIQKPRCDMPTRHATSSFSNQSTKEEEHQILLPAATVEEDEVQPDQKYLSAQVSPQSVTSWIPEFSAPDYGDSFVRYDTSYCSQDLSNRRNYKDFSVPTFPVQSHDQRDNSCSIRESMGGTRDAPPNFHQSHSWHDYHTENDIPELGLGVRDCKRPQAVTSCSAFQHPPSKQNFKSKDITCHKRVEQPLSCCNNQSSKSLSLFAVTSVSRGKCIPMKHPIPFKFQGDMVKAREMIVPEFPRLVNFPDYISEKRSMNLPGGMRRCVMCGEACPFVPAKKDKKHPPPKKCKKGTKTGKDAHNRPQQQNGGGSTPTTIPTQNKGVCNVCDVRVWVVTDSGIQIKWCKGCKNFLSWASFGEKGLATKCMHCRQRQREKYAEKKEERWKARLAQDGKKTKFTYCTKALNNSVMMTEKF